MSKKKSRAATEAELSEYIDNMQKGVGAKLDEIQKLVPAGYMITLVARHPETPSAGFVFTKDNDLDAVADEIEKTNRTLKSVEDEPDDTPKS